MLDIYHDTIYDDVVVSSQGWCTETLEEIQDYKRGKLLLFVQDAILLKQFIAPYGTVTPRLKYVNNDGDIENLHYKYYYESHNKMKSFCFEEHSYFFIEDGTENVILLTNCNIISFGSDIDSDSLLKLPDTYKTTYRPHFFIKKNAELKAENLYSGMIYDSSYYQYQPFTQWLYSFLKLNNVKSHKLNGNIDVCKDDVLYTIKPGTAVLYNYITNDFQVIDLETFVSEYKPLIDLSQTEVEKLVVDYKAATQDKFILSSYIYAAGKTNLTHGYAIHLTEENKNDVYAWISQFINEPLERKELRDFFEDVKDCHLMIPNKVSVYEIMCYENNKWKELIAVPVEFLHIGSISKDDLYLMFKDKSSYKDVTEEEISIDEYSSSELPIHNVVYDAMFVDETLTYKSIQFDGTNLKQIVDELCPADKYIISYIEFADANAKTINLFNVYSKDKQTSVTIRKNNYVVETGENDVTYNSAGIISVSEKTFNRCFKIISTNTPK